MSELEIYKGMVKKMKDDEIKEILDYLKNDDYCPAFADEGCDDTPYKLLDEEETKLLLDYITNLQQENERLKWDKEQLNNLVNVCQKEIRELKEKLKQYENPDDLTLFYMWLDEEAKDKMKHMENEITQLKQFNQMLTEMGEDYKSRCEKVQKIINIEKKKMGYAIYDSCLLLIEEAINGRSDE